MRLFSFTLIFFLLFNVKANAQEQIKTLPKNVMTIYKEVMKKFSLTLTNPEKAVWEEEKDYYVSYNISLTSATSIPFKTFVGIIYKADPETKEGVSAMVQFRFKMASIKDMSFKGFAETNFRKCAVSTFSAKGNDICTVTYSYDISKDKLTNGSYEIIYDLMSQKTSIDADCKKSKLSSDQITELLALADMIDTF
jgi:hypothetical protein